MQEQSRPQRQAAGGMTGANSRPFRFLDLPAEIRLLIYEAILVRDEPIEIKRRPARFWCQVDKQWSLVDLYDSSAARQSHEAHLDCLREIRDILRTDLCSEFNVQLHASHFPCPKLLDKSVNSGLGLGILQACRQVYREARHMAYSKNTFLVCYLNAFSNFLYCLKSWQVESIGHLDFDIVESRGMTIFLAEWNDLFSLIAASFTGLQTVAITVQLINLPHIWGSSFWDAGLLELDRINLKSAQFVIIDGLLRRQFMYTAGKEFSRLVSTLNTSSLVEQQAQDITDPAKPESPMVVMQDPSVSFHRCRDRLREIHSYDPNNASDTILFFRFARSPCPLYVRNLIHLVSQRARSDRNIRHEDRLQRDFVPYKYVHKGDTHDTAEAKRVVGYQFRGGEDYPDYGEIDRGVLNVLSARQRLAAKLRAGDSNFVKPPARLTNASPIRQQPSSNQRNPMDSSVGLVDFSLPGHWRRRLNEEMFSPFFETFPHQIVERAETEAWKCYECATPAMEIKCFATT